MNTSDFKLLFSANIVAVEAMVTGIGGCRNTDYPNCRENINSNAIASDLGPMGWQIF